MIKSAITFEKVIFMEFPLYRSQVRVRQTNWQDWFGLNKHSDKTVTEAIFKMFIFYLFMEQIQ